MEAVLAINYRNFDGDFQTVTFLAAALGSGLMAGLYFVFANFVMKSLSKIPPSSGIAAMQSINREILNPFFFLIFFGTLAAGLAASFGAISFNMTRADLWAAAGTGCYGIGFLITIFFNVPLNNKLDEISASGGDEADQVWDSYIRKWGRWNTARFYCTLASAVGFMLAVYFHLEPYEWIEPD